MHLSKSGLIKLCSKSLQLLLQLLVKSLVLEGAFVELLLLASLANGFVSHIVELSDHSVVDLAICGLSQDIHDLDDLLLGVKNFLHHLLANLLVLDLHAALRVNVKVAVHLLNDFIAGLSLIDVLFLDVLDEIKHLLVDELYPSLEPDVLSWILDLFSLELA